MTPRPLRWIITTVLACALLAIGVGGLVARSADAAPAQPTQFRHTGGPQVYVVPDNVDHLLVQAVGAGGGNAAPATGPFGTTVIGGPGASVTTLLAVTPGQVLQVNVGGKGQPGGANQADGGWNGGGDAGVGSRPFGDNSTYGTEAGAGGGATDIRACATAIDRTCRLADRVIVAGGGGGAGVWNAGSGLPLGGSGGEPTGAAGGATAETNPGGGGTAVAGGAGGQGSGTFSCTGSGAVPNGVAGTLGVGGMGGGVGTVDGSGHGGFGGGGGGGGYYGGGGGGCAGNIGMGTAVTAAAAGGGGSSWADPAVNSSTTFAPTTVRPIEGYVVMQGVRLEGASAPQVFTVPAQVTTLSVFLEGATGGSWNMTPGGGGALVQAGMNVTPGMSIQVNVGGGGESTACPDVCAYMTQGGPPGYQTGWNGGGGASPSAYYLWAWQSGGGGGTDLRVCPRADAGKCDLADRVLVAGGGGGSSAYHVWEYPAPGGTAGCWPSSPGGTGGTDGGPGGGGGASAGGDGGASGPSFSFGGQNGALGQGGQGGEGDSGFTQSYNGGGGGGGYYGGGGGGGGGSEPDIFFHSAGSGGAGSSAVLPYAAGFTDTSCSAGPPGADIASSSRDGQVTLGFVMAVPSQPRAVGASGSAGSATVTWTAPADPRGTVTAYTVQSSLDGASWTTAATTSGSALSTTLTGLDPNSTYVFRVAASNAAGIGPWSTPSGPVNSGDTAPQAVAAAPVVTQAPDGDALALTWAAPNDGGSAITGYAVWMSTNGGSYAALATNTGSSSASYVASGLSSASNYAFKVAAINAIGTGGQSPASTAATPLGIPTAPGTPTAVAGFEQATLTFAPASIAGSQVVSGYEVRWSTDGGTTWTTSAGPVDTTASSGNRVMVVTRLGDFQNTVFQVRALHGEVIGPWSASSTAVRPDTRPGPPRNVLGGALDEAIALHWQVPDSTGGGTITGYRIESRDVRSAGNPWVLVTASTNSTSTQATVHDLENGVPYSFRVSTVTDAGGQTLVSPEQGSALPVRPGTQAAAPTALGATAGNASVGLTWTAPANTGGRTIIGYRIQVLTGTSWTDALASTGSAATSATVSGLSNGTAYRFRVAAITGLGTGAFDALPSSVTPEPPADPAPATPTSTAVASIVRTTRSGHYTVLTTVRVSGAGVLTQRGTRFGRRGAQAAACAARKTMPAAGTTVLTCALNLGTRAAARQSPVRLKLATTFAPSTGPATNLTRTIVIPRYDPAARVTG